MKSLAVLFRFAEWFHSRGRYWAESKVSLVVDLEYGAGFVTEEVSMDDAGNNASTL